MNTDTEKCVICTRPIPSIYKQNNPRPVRDAGYCCDSCNIMVIIPARLPTSGQAQAGSRIKTCFGDQGYYRGNYHYWWSPGQDRWIGVHTDVHGDANGGLFYGPTQESILHTIGQFTRLGVTG
jgi:hypothetical protein